MRVLSDLLKKISDREKEVLGAHEIRHAPTIGRMYEGLTKRLLNHDELDRHGVKVVSGFMRSGSTLSGQIDCMVVIGEGDVVPETDEFIYPICQVLAVIEVKKNMYAAELGEAYRHLNDTLRLSKADYQKLQDEGKLNFDASRPAEEYLNLFGELPPRYEESRTLPFHKRVVYHHLVRERLTPVRIAIGYNGYKSEHNLRSALSKLFDGKANTLGYGVLNMPNLIISDGFSIIKMNGLPYRGVWDDRFGWAWLASSSSNPFLLILELLYDRIELVLGSSVDRGVDLEEEVLNALAFATPIKTEKGMGWNYMLIDADQPENEPKNLGWSPLEISIAQLELLKLVLALRELQLDHALMKKWQNQYEVENIAQTLASLLDARYLISNGKMLSVALVDLAVQNVCGRWYCAEAGERFQQWCLRAMRSKGHGDR
jgi:hypothetical protein